MAWAWYASLPFGGVVKFTGHTGDSYNSTGMAEFQDAIKAIHPGIFVHSVYIDKDLDNDRKAGFVRIKFWICPGHIINSLRVQYGNVNNQVAFVAEQLDSISELKNGFDAIGFSQGAFIIGFIW